MIEVYDIINDPLPKLKLTREINEDPHCPQPDYTVWILDKYFDMGKLFYERCYCVALDESENIKGIMMVSSGDDSGCEVYKKNIGIFLLLIGAAQFIICHNHPNGATKASDDDKISMGTIIDLGKLIEIEMVEDYIITKNGWYGTRCERRCIYAEE